MTTPDQNPPASWVDAALAVLTKTASGQDDRAVAEAFAQQAYTTISNRCREIMRDPYLLGFEIVEKNEENTRLLGVFAFRIGGIVLAPVFYLNGQTKGQDLLYRKGPNLFTRNDDKWIRYLLSQAGDDRDGRPVGRASGNARMHLGLGEFYNGSPGFRKAASAEDPDGGIDITACFREDFGDVAALMKKALATDGILAGFLHEAGVAKSAALLVERVPEVGDAIALSGALDAPVKSAATEVPSFSGLVWHAEPSAEMTEEQVSSFYRRGYLLEDKRAAEEKAVAFTTADAETRVATAYEPGVIKALDRSGAFHKALMGPADVLRKPHKGWGCHTDSGKRQGYMMLFLEGPHKDTTFWIDSGKPSSTPMVEVEPSDNDSMPKGEEPVAGGEYCIWIKGKGFVSSWPLAVHSVDKAGEALRLNGGGHGIFALVRRDIEESETPGDSPAIYGADALFIRTGSVKKDTGVCSPCAIEGTNTGFIPMTPVDFMFGGLKSKTAAVTITHRRGLNDILVGGRRVCDGLSQKQTVLKLARDFRLPVDEAEELAFGIEDGGRREFVWIAPVKSAGWEDAMRATSPASPIGLKAPLVPMGGGFNPPAFPVPKPVEILSPQAQQKALGSMLLPQERPITPPSGADVRNQAGMDYKARQAADPDVGSGGVAEVKPSSGVSTPTSDSSGWQLPSWNVSSAQAGSPQAIQAGVDKMLAPVRAGSALAAVTPPPSGADVRNQANTDYKARQAADPDVGRGGVAEVKPRDWRAEFIAATGSQFEPTSPMDRLNMERLQKGLPTLDVKQYRALRKTAALQKLAGFFFDRPIDPEVEFEDEGWDEDFDIPVDIPERSFRAYATREVTPSPERHYLDVRDPQTRNREHGRQQLTHIPDEVLMNMANPGVELAELGRRMGLNSLLDHGAVASMAKVFDAKTFIGKYVDRMEQSLDALARVIFLLYWKPKDFSEMFGEDDLSVLENKLTGVFQSYADLVLELLQSVGDKMK